MADFYSTWLYANTTKKKLVKALNARNLGLTHFVETTNNSYSGFKAIASSVSGSKNDICLAAIATSSKSTYYKTVANKVPAPEYVLATARILRSTKANYIVSLDDLLDTYMAGLLIGHKEALEELRIKYAEKLGY